MRTLTQKILFVIVLHIVLIYVLFSCSIKNHVPQEDSVRGWEKSVSRDVNDYISSDNFRLIPEHICDRPSLLLVIVCSSVREFDARMTIRQTWGQEQVVLGQNVSVYFLVGETTNLTVLKQLRSESNNFGDVIQGKFLDSYKNLTLKSIYMLITATLYCFNNAKFLLKIDDDILLNMENLITLLKEMEEVKNILMGKLRSGIKPINNPSKKWYTPDYMFKGRVFPKYVFGAGYVMSMDVAKKLFKVTLSTPILHIEDVYTTGICAKKAGVIPIDNVYFSFRFIYRHFYFYHHSCKYVHCIALRTFDLNMIMNLYQNLSDRRTQDNCRNYQPQFNAHNWVVRNIHKKL